MKRITHFCLSLITVFLLFTACKKDSFITSSNASLSISIDSLTFDTVFTTVGSITKSFKIINNNNQKIQLSTVKLKVGNASAFKINVNGQPGAAINNIEIAADDSIYVFVSVTIDPNNNNLPFLITDSVQIDYNGNSRYVPLLAYGQNAIFLNNKIIEGNVSWTKDLPYVILGDLHIDATAKLTLEAGTRVFVHADAPIIVDGTLITNGTKTANVTFAGDRLDADYKDLPAGWPGIYFRGESKDNVLKYTIVKNAYQAIVAEKPAVNANPKVILHQCIIDNAWDAGITCVNSSLQADNTLVSNCGSNISLTYGGDYTLTHCTVVGISNNFIVHKKPVLVANNFASQDGITITSDLNATFRNCIFWGDAGLVENELSINKQGATVFNVILDHCLYRVKDEPPFATFNNVIKNQDPLFDSINVNKQIFNFRISKENAPGTDKGVITAFAEDLDGNNRNNGLPDIGCYEKQ